jgi:hypothetical protein
VPRLAFVRPLLALLCVATLLAAPFVLSREADRLRPAATGAAGGVSAAPLLALAILGAMSGLVLLVAMRPARR